MNIIKKYYLLVFRKFDKNDPKNFRLKIVESWFSKDFVQITYSTNNSLTWNYIHYCKDSIGIDYDYEWNRISYSLSLVTHIKSERKKFSSYEKITEYEKIEKEKLITGNKRLKKNRELKEEKRKESFKKVNEYES